MILSLEIGCLSKTKKNNRQIIVFIKLDKKTKTRKKDPGLFLCIFHFLRHFFHTGKKRELLKYI